MTEIAITVLPYHEQITAKPGSNLLDALRKNGVLLDASCGGSGKCGKCKVLIGGQEVLACQAMVVCDMVVTIPNAFQLNVLQTGIDVDKVMNPSKDGYLLAFDIGTTSVVCFLLNGKTGTELAASSMLNPQTAFGADVISRIQIALRGEQEQQTNVIRDGMITLIKRVCKEAKIDPTQIGVVSVVGNPTMQQLFLGISPENLAGVPFSPVLTEAKIIPYAGVLPICSNADLLIVPDISGYIGADTIGCVLATEL